MRTVVVHDESKLRPWIRCWDELSAERGRPFCSPSWMLPWWHWAAPPGARLRTIVVLDGETVAGIAPFFVQRAYGGLTRYRLLGATTGTPIEPLARPGLELPVATALAEEVASVAPAADLVTLEGATPGWSEWICDAWPGRARPWFHHDLTGVAPVLDLRGRSFDEWFASKSRNFRQQIGGSQRKLRAHGFRSRIVTGHEDIEFALRAMSKLHLRRWERRGGSAGWRPGTGPMLHEVATRLLDPGRFRLYTIEDGKDIISAQLFIAAGRHSSYWLGGFDERWAKLRPGLIALVNAVRDAWQRCDESVDFGRGVQGYKIRMADGREALEWTTLVPRGAASLRTRLHLAPKHGARAIADRLPDEVRMNVRRRFRPPAWLR